MGTSATADHLRTGVVLVALNMTNGQHNPTSQVAYGTGTLRFKERRRPRCGYEEAEEMMVYGKKNGQWKRIAVTYVRDKPREGVRSGKGSLMEGVNEVTR